MKMKTITAKEFYSGYDPGTEHDFTLEAGESIDISEEKFDQLERDGLLERFEVGEVNADPEPEDITKLKRDALDKIAVDLRIDDPDKLDNRQAVIDAIEARRTALSTAADGLEDLDREQLLERAASIGVAVGAEDDDEEILSAIRSAAHGHEGTEVATS
jgi:hypothetical protein